MVLLAWPGLFQAQTTTNVGTDFWLAFPTNCVYNPSYYIYVSGTTAATGTVSSAVPGVNQSFSVVPGQVTQIVLPVAVGLVAGIENKGVHLTSSAPVSVYGTVYSDGSSGGYMALPQPSLGTYYRVVSYITSYLTGHGSALIVIANQNNTALTIYNQYTAATTNINLSQGQTYYLEEVTGGADLSGSWVQSNLPVSVLGTAECVSTPPNNCGSGDNIVEQMMPVNTWGKSFITASLAGRGNLYDVFRIMANDDNTVLQVNGAQVAVLGAGGIHEVQLYGNNSITANKPIMVAQYSRAIDGCLAAPITGDALMIMVPPQEQFLTAYTIINPSNFVSNWVNLIATQGAMGSIYEDGVLLPVTAFTAVGGTGYSVANRQVATGPHTYTASAPFGVFVYAWNEGDAFGYTGGCALSPVATVTGVSLSPASASGILNLTNVCLTAHVTNSNGLAVEGILVNFNRTGCNSFVGNAYTNALGDAVYCYTQTGGTACTDLVTANVGGLASSTTPINWQPCLNPTNGGTIAAPQNGCMGLNPTALTSTAPASGFSVGTVEYKWQQSTTSASLGFTDIPGATLPDYDPGPLLLTTWFKRLAKVSCASSWASAAASNVVAITISTPPPPVQIKHN